MLKVSIIISVYNAQNYLLKNLNSLRNQTLKEIEFICVDDGSEDNSLEILKNIAKEDNRFTILTQKNQGQGAARNLALKYVKGEYIGFVDCDDKVEKDMFEKMYNAAKKYDVDIVQCDYKLCFEDEIEYKNTRLMDEKELKPNKVLKFEDYKDQIFNIDSCYSWMRIFRGSLIKENSIEFSPIKNMDDHPFSILVRFYANSQYFIPKAYYSYIIHNSNVTSSNKPDAHLVIQTIKSKLQNNPRFKKQKKKFNEYIVKCLACEYFQSTDDEKKKLIEKIEKNYNKKVLKNFKNYINNTNYSFFERVFSVKNNNQKTHKVISIFGFKIKIRRKNG